MVVKTLPPPSVCKQIAQVVHILGLLDVAHQDSRRQKLVVTAGRPDRCGPLRPRRAGFPARDTAQDADQEGHREGFARAGGVPDHADAPVGLHAARVGRQRFFGRQPHGKELVVLARLSW